ncbi:MAG: DNA repair protein RecO [Coriobacteriales bacterium]|nr:DNA repair protein RecO [Coriobacteriales bacterium]
MPNYPARALVLKKTKLNESDLIITFLAQDGRQIRAVAKGVRKPMSKLCGMLELASVSDLLFAQGRNLDVVIEARQVANNEGCRCDLEHTAAASCICELLSKFSLEDEPQDRLFAMSCKALEVLATAQGANIQLLVAAFIVQVTSRLGYRPDLHECVLCGQQVERARFFSFEGGGVICGDCMGSLEGFMDDMYPQISWLAFMLGSTFDRIAGCDVDVSTADTMLHFTERWLHEHTGLRLKSSELLRPSF